MATSVDEERRQHAIELLAGDRAALLATQPFLSLLALRLDIVPVTDPRLSVAATDGDRLYFDLSMVFRLGAAERRMLIAHLVWHVALLHPWRRAGRQRALWDLAIDHEVNHLLEPDFALPPGSPWFEEHGGDSAERLYEKLLAEPPPLGRGPLADLHLDVTQLSTPEAGTVDPRFCPAVSTDGRRRTVERLLGARQRLRARGLEPPPVIRELLASFAGSAVPWREVLASFLSNALGDRRHFLPPNRRALQRGLYLPSRRSETLRVVVALDTSASTQGLQARFLSELVALVAGFDRYELCLVDCDDRVRSVRRFSSAAPLRPGSIELSGLGATDFRPVFEWITAQPEPPRALLWLTDGRGPAPTHPPPYPVLWALPDDGIAPASWGQVVHLPPTPRPTPPGGESPWRWG